MYKWIQNVQIVRKVNKMIQSEICSSCKKQLYNGNKSDFCQCLTLEKEGKIIPTIKLDRILEQLENPPIGTLNFYTDFDLRNALNVNRWIFAVQELDNELRRLVKHGDDEHNEDWMLGIEYARDKLWEYLEDNDVNLRDVE